ncbi:hypothetical protein BH23ACT9_BH23ACT9_21840 [soil metagenome]
MRAVVDSSTWISLAWSGQLPLLTATPLTPVVLDSVYRETVAEGLARGHADAAAIEHAMGAATRMDDPLGRTVDDRVVAAAAAVGLVVTNDLVVGRRANNLGARWLRTADLVVLAVRSHGIEVTSGHSAIAALHASGRLTDALRDAYMQEL